MSQSRNDTDKHFFKLFSFPKDSHLFSFSVDVLEIKSVFYVFANDSDTECIVHGFIEEVSIKLDDVWMILSFKQLYGFFLKTQMRLAIKVIPCIR